MMKLIKNTPTNSMEEIPGDAGNIDCNAMGLTTISFY